MPGYIKRTAADTYRHQSRGGKGRIGARTKEEDFVEHLFIASAHSYILLFTSKGRVYWLKVYELPEAAAATRGKAISSLVKFQEDEKLTALVAARNLEEAGQFVFMATSNGTVKKSALTEFSNPRSTGIIAITLDGKDELIGAKLTDGKKMIFLASHEGQAILFRETEVRPMGRSAGGVNGMDLDKEDYVVSMDAVQPDFAIIEKEHKQTTQNLEELENEHIKDSLTTLMLTVAEKGFGKRTPLAEYRITSRGGKGVVNMKTTDRNGSVVATLQVTEESDVMIITHNGKVIRVHANEIREAGRSTQGVACCGWMTMIPSPPPPSCRKKTKKRRSSAPWPASRQSLSHRSLARIQHSCLPALWCAPRRCRSGCRRARLRGSPRHRFPRRSAARQLR